MSRATDSGILFRPFHILYLTTESDFLTFVIPNTFFGVFAALSGRCLLPFNAAVDYRRVLLTLAFNYGNLLIFDLANQRLARSVVEDTNNKPWRPIPAGYLSSESATWTLRLAAPVILAYNYYRGTGTETVLLYLLTYLYNDVGLGDTFARDATIAIAFSLYNLGSLRTAGGRNSTISVTGLQWISLISAVILTTMHVQDLKDMKGDLERGRRTIPLRWGASCARRAFAVAVVGWSAVVCSFWRVALAPASGVMCTGGWIAWRALQRHGVEKDRRTWQVWCLWLLILYAIPCLALLHD